MRRRRTAALALPLSLLLALPLAGCLSSGLWLGAAPAALGRTEKGFALGGLVFERGLGRAILPSPELIYRRGMGPDWDLGVRVWAAGAEATARWQVHAGGGLTVALLPGAEVAWVPATDDFAEVLHARLGGGLLADLQAGAGFTATAALRFKAGFAGPLTVFRGVADGSRLLLEPGAVIGAGLQLTEGLVLRAEAGVEQPIALGAERRLLAGHAGLALVWRTPGP